MWQYEPQGHFFFTTFSLNEVLQMWQPMAPFLDDVSEVAVVLVVHRRRRFSTEESMLSRGLFWELFNLDALTNGSPKELVLERFFDHL